MFEFCYQLKTPIIPESVEVIDGYAFRDCRNMESITIPQNIKHIGYNAFGGCTAIKKIYTFNTTPPQFIFREGYPRLDSNENDGFEDYHYRNATLYVPKGTLSIYWLNPYWEKFYNVFELDVSNIETVKEIKRESDYIYNLNGIRVPQGSARKGIYFKNGKKVIIK